MSQTYPEYSNTNFPDGFDAIDLFLDPSLQEISLIQQYNALYNAGDIAGANAIIKSNPILKRMCVNAKTMNQFRDIVLALQHFFVDGVQTYLVNIVKYKGTWSNTVKYTKYNVVQYTVGNVTSAYMAIQIDIPIGTLPTDSSYYICMTLQGEQGASGTGCSPRGAWNATVNYYADDMVSHNNALWYALEDNTNAEPSKTSTSWQLMLEFASSMLLYSNTNSGLVASTFQEAVDELAKNLKTHTDESGSIHIPSGGSANQVLGWKSSGVAEWVNIKQYEHPTTSGYKHIPSGGTSGQRLEWESDGTAKWVTPTNATTTSDGRMSSDDKTKLDGIQAGAQVNTVTGVKGDAETSYRVGNINITPAAIGTVAVKISSTAPTDTTVLWVL